MFYYIFKNKCSEAYDMEKQILHIDCNKFYASVECYLHPELRDKPIAVGCSEESRHGIILTKNEIAAKYNLQVGEPLWKAREKCPDLIIVEPNFPVYIEFSQKVRAVLEDYTDLIEPFGLDESWIDVTGDWYKTGEQIACEIKDRIKNEVGITVSVGVSYNKIFAKFGSDYKKPDAVTVITRDNYKDIVWKSPCRDMIMVGRATARKLDYYGIRTLGQLACADDKFLKNTFGKNGLLLKRYARGEDMSPVRHKDFQRDIKSVGNSITTPRDLVNNEDVKIVFTALAESVSRRMRKLNLKGRTLTVYVKNKEFESFTCRCKFPNPTNISGEMIKTAMRLFTANYSWQQPVRCLGLTVSDFDCDGEMQYDFMHTVQKRERLERLDAAMDAIKDRYGVCSIGHGTLLMDKRLSYFDVSDKQDIHMFSYS